MSRSGEPHTPHDADHDSAVETFLVMQTTQSWNDVPYTHYPAGTPQLAVMRFHIPPTQLFAMAHPRRPQRSLPP